MPSTTAVSVDLTERMESAADELAAIRGLLQAGERAGRRQQDAEALILTTRELRGLSRILDRAAGTLGQASQMVGR